MDKEFLEDYETKEFEDSKRFREWVTSDGKTENPRFKRLMKPQHPFVRAYTFHGESIWPQVPMSGSLILRIPCLHEKDFEKSYNIKVSEISDLVNFIKDTGKIQITLGSRPSDYVGLDYLDPIFEELHPIYETAYPNEAFVDEKEVIKHVIEFQTLGNIKYFNFLQQLYRMVEEKNFMKTSPPLVVEGIIRREAQAYITLKILGYNEIIDEIQRLMIDDPLSVNKLFYLIQYYITTPFSDSLCESFSSSLQEAKKLAQDTRKYVSLQQRSLEKINIPFEIGSFLMTTLTHYPESLHACKELIAHYESSDLMKVASELNQGIREFAPDLINQNRDELLEIMSNLWEDKSIVRKIKGLRFGIPLTIGIVGAAAFGPIEGITGFLAGLGFTVGDKTVDFLLDNISEKIAKFFSTSYQANIYDFKKNHHIL